MWPLLFFKGIFIYESDNIEEEFIMLAFVRCTGSKHCAIRVHLPGYEVKQGKVTVYLTLEGFRKEY